MSTNRTISGDYEEVSGAGFSISSNLRACIESVSVEPELRPRRNIKGSGRTTSLHGQGRRRVPDRSGTQRYISAVVNNRHTRSRKSHVNEIASIVESTFQNVRPEVHVPPTRLLISPPLTTAS